jgi:hypothetical protein
VKFFVGEMGFGEIFVGEMYPNLRNQYLDGNCCRDSKIYKIEIKAENEISLGWKKRKVMFTTKLRCSVFSVV